MTVSACVLSHRALVRLSGNDKESFLQGLLTNNIAHLTPEKSLFSLLLSPQGRIQYDLLMYQFDNDFFLEVDIDRTESFLKRLSIFKLRSQVGLDNVSTKTILSLWGENLPAPLDFSMACLGSTRSTSLGTWVVDPRQLKLGCRLIIDSDCLDHTIQSLGLTMMDLAAYRRHRYALGIPEGAAEIETDRAIPLEWAMDELHAIDWNKGCYMGQELTARTRYRGLVRKRIFSAHSSIRDLSHPLMDGDQEVGRWIAKEGDVGLAMVRLDFAQSALTCNGQIVTLTHPVTQ